MRKLVLVEPITYQEVYDQLKDVKKIDESISNTERFIIVDSENVEIKFRYNTTLLGYICDDDGNSRAKITGNEVELIGDISEHYLQLLDISPDLFGYRVSYTKVDEVYLYIVEYYDKEVYTISNYEIDFEDIE